MGLPLTDLVHRAYQVILDTLFPPRCVTCDAGGAWFCARCQANIIPLTEPWCPRCLTATPEGKLCEHCRDADVALAGLAAAGVHDGVLRAAILAYKYGNRQPLADPLSRLIVEAIAPATLHATLVMPVPSHPRRVAQRGYDHADMLASRVAVGLGLPYDNTRLVRVRFTQPQARMTAQERHANVADAFKSAALPDQPHVLLVDDVYTSGSTMRACAKELLVSGAAGVTGAVAARA